MASSRPALEHPARGCDILNVSAPPDGERRRDAETGDRRRVQWWSHPSGNLQAGTWHAADAPRHPLAHLLTSFTNWSPHCANLAKREVEDEQYRGTSLRSNARRRTPLSNSTRSHHTEVTEELYSSADAPTTHALPLIHRPTRSGRARHGAHERATRTNDSAHEAATSQRILTDSP